MENENLPTRELRFLQMIITYSMEGQKSEKCLHRGYLDLTSSLKTGAFTVESIDRSLTLSLTLSLRRR
jgi:hypothetical protein